MEKRIKEAFDAIEAEEELKAKTKQEVARKIRANESAARHPGVYRLAAILLVVMISVSGVLGYASCTMAASTITIEGDTRVEWDVNLWNHLICERRYNQQGELVLSCKRSGSYAEAMEEYLEQEQGKVNYSVTGGGQGRCQRICQELDETVARCRNGNGQKNGSHNGHGGKHHGS